MAGRGRGAIWDKERGRQMYDAGASTLAIAQACGVTRGVVAGHAGRYWPVREIDAERRLKYTHQHPAKPRIKRLAKGAPTLAPLGSLVD